MIKVDSRNVNLTVKKDSGNIPSLFMGVILTHTNMLVYIYGKWVYTWGGGGDCSSKQVYIPKWVWVVWIQQLLSLSVVFFHLVWN